MTNGLIILGSVASCFPESNYVFLAGIFIYGLAAGCYQVFCTMYINEAAPMEVRGSAGALT